MKFKKDTRQDRAVVTITREEYVFEDGEIWWRYGSEFKDPYIREVKRDSWVVNSKTGQSRQSELDRKIMGER
jgi:hypothetical protein